MTEPNDNWYSPAQIVDPLPGYRVPTVPTQPTNYLDASRPYVDTTEQTFISTLGDRAIFGSTEGGAGRWLFGALRTPQRFIVDQILSIDETIDDQFIANRSKNTMEFIDSMDEMTKRLLMAAGNDRPGGYDQMIDDLASTSTSRQNLASRIDTINEIYKAKQRIDAYDAETNFASYAFIKTTSGVLNYATVDPLIVAPLGATALTSRAGVVAARSVAAGTAVNNLTRAQRIGYFFEQHRNYAFAADLLWNTMDGAQAGYSNFVSYNLDQQKIYGSSDTDENWTDNVLAGAGIAAGFTVGTHLLTAGLRSPGRPGREEAISNMRDLEQLGAHSNQHLSTPSDIVFQDRMYRARTDLEGVVGLTEDSESTIMRTIRNADEMNTLGYRTPEQVQELADWIRTNRPTSAELGDRLTERFRLRAMNHAESMRWQSEVDDWMAAGGDDPAHWYGAKAAEYLRRIVGDDEYGNYKWMLDWFKNRAGGVDNESLARWLMNADKDNLDRLVAMRDLEDRISKVEGKALKDSLDEISRRRGEHWDDAIAADHQKAIDDINEARWFEAVESLERMWEKQKARAGNVLANLDSLIDEANKADRNWGRNLNRKLKAYRNVVDAANRLKEMINGRVLYPQEGTNRILNGLMDPDAAAGDLHVMAREAIADDARRMDPGNMNAVSQASREEFEAVQQQLLKAVEDMHKFEDRARSYLGTRVSNLRSVYRRTGDLRREFSMEFGLPVDQYHMTFNGFRAVMRNTARTVVDAQRHNVSLVDNVYGAGAAEGYLARGEFPSRPVRRTTAVRPLPSVDDEMAIFEKNLGDQVEQLKREAADNPKMDAKRVAMTLEANDLRNRAAQARNLASNPMMNSGRSAEVIRIAERYERRARALDRAARRITTELERRTGTFQPPARPTATRLTELPGVTSRNARTSARIAEIGQELGSLSDADRLGSRGAKLRADLRKANAQLGAQTAFDARRRLLTSTEAAVADAQRRVDDLVNAGNTDRAPALVQARRELEQITKTRDSLQATIRRTENAQAVFQRRSSLHGNAPRADDVVALSRLMAAINAAQAAGRPIASLTARLYDEFGNVANLPRWAELEDAYQEAFEAVQRGERPPTIRVRMEGRQARISVEYPRSSLGAATSTSTAAKRMVSNSGTVGSGLKELSSSPEYGALARRLDTDLPDDVANVPYESGTTSRSHYGQDTKTGLPVVRLSQDAGDDAFIHEAVHAATFLQIKNALQSAGFNPRLTGKRYLAQLDQYLKVGTNESVKKLIRSYRDVLNKIGSDSELARRLNAGGEANLSGGRLYSSATGTEYAMRNLDEFVAQAFSDPTFRQFLRDIKLDDAKKSAWSDFVDLIKDLLGIKRGTTEATQLDRVMNTVDEIKKQEPADISKTPLTAGFIADRFRQVLSDPQTTVKEAAAKAKKIDPVKTTGKEAVDERKAALSSWLDETAAGGEGDRLVATNRLMASMAQIPIMRNLGAGLLRLMTAGTGFGRVHGVARDLDMLVTVFNMLDRPEATERAHGLIGNVVHTLETHRNKGRMFLNRAAAAAQNAGLSYSTPEAWTRINAALDTGDTSGLRGQEVEVYNALRQSYDYYADAYRTIHGRDPQVENYRPRFPIVDQLAGNRTQAAHQFRDVYAERMRTPGNELTPEICDEIGVPRGTVYDPAMGGAVEAAIDNHATRMGVDSVNRLSNSMTTDGMGGWRYTYSTNSARGRVLENEVFNDPRLSRYFIQHPLEGLRQYINTTGPEMSFHAQLCRMTGQTGVTFHELLDTVAERFARLNDPEVTAEAANVIRLIREKADMAFGRTQYTHTDLLDTGFRAGNGIIKSTTGSFWGMAGMLGEVPRAVFASRHGGPIRGLIEAMQALHRTNDLDAIQDVAHAVDQYTTMTHSHTGAGSSVGLTTWDRFVEPWRRFRNVAIGSESELHYGTNQTMGRIKGTTIAGLEALGESSVRGGLLQWASGFARITADRLAKRHLVRNIQGMRILAEELEAIGPVARQTPETARRFREAAARAGIDYDVALHMNHSGLLTREVVDQLQNALSLPGVAPSGVFELNRLQGIGERAYMGLVSYLTDAHNFHVPTAGLAQSVPVSNALGKLYYQLTSYSRAFSTTIGMRGTVNMPLRAAALTFGAVMLGETLYQNSRDVAKGKKTWDDVMTEYDDNPTAFYFKNGLKSPWLGGHHSTYMSMVDAVTPGKLGFDSTRGNSAFSTILSSYSQIARQVSEKEPDEASFNILKSHTPVVNAWYSRLLMEGFK